MTENCIPKLIWELIQKDVPIAEHFELRSILGSDLIDQSLEIKNEVFITKNMLDSIFI